jgi:hypothetical protein
MAMELEQVRVKYRKMQPQSQEYPRVNYCEFVFS